MTDDLVMSTILIVSYRLSPIMTDLLHKGWPIIFFQRAIWNEIIFKKKCLAAPLLIKLWIYNRDKWKFFECHQKSHYCHLFSIPVLDTRTWPTTLNCLYAKRHIGIIAYRTRDGTQSTLRRRNTLLFVVSAVLQTCNIANLRSAVQVLLH